MPDAVAASPQFLLAVVAGAGTTVLAATLLGFPVSTTHGLTGALVGAGFAAAGPALDLGKLGAIFVAPLLLSPVLAVALTLPLYGLLHRTRMRMALTKESCVCIGEVSLAPSARRQAGGMVALRPMGVGLAASLGPTGGCTEKYTGRVLDFSVQRLLDTAHFASAGIVSFARGLNDTPKIAGLLLFANALNLRTGVLAIGLAMAIGGLLNARKVAHTMSGRIAQMNDGQAFTANLVTALLVILASRLGLPVSTTHVSVGAIAGAGIVNGSAARGVLSSIFISWVLTLPIAALAGTAAYAILDPFLGAV